MECRDVVRLRPSAVFCARLKRWRISLRRSPSQPLRDRSNNRWGERSRERWRFVLSNGRMVSIEDTVVFPQTAVERASLEPQQGAITRGEATSSTLMARVLREGRSTLVFFWLTTSND